MGVFNKVYLVRTWQHKRNYKYLKAHHNAHFSTFVRLGGGSGSMPGNKMLLGLFQETTATIKREMKKLKNCKL